MIVAAADVSDSLGSILTHPFMRYALVAGTAVALACGVVGYFLVLRGQVFTGDALSHVAFTGALAALAFGIDPRLGLFATTVTVAIGMGILGSSGRADDVVIGSVFAWVLGLGVLFLGLYTTGRSGTIGSNGAAGVSVLFGSIFGLSRTDAIGAAAVGGAVAAAVLVVARPLLFATVEEAVARARGLPVAGLGIGFLALVGLTAAESTAVVGALLLVGLLAAPAAAAQRLTVRPYLGLSLSAAISVASVWVGLAISYVIARVPPSFAIIATAVSVYAVVAFAPRARMSWIRRPSATTR
jgi:zinc/manganese transport system permease protein